jgi:predicted nicotinamide N-methyase
MPGYATKQESIAVTGVDDLIIRSLLDRQQFADALGAAERLGISPSNWPLFGLLWPSGAHLAARLALRPVVAAERILEIGCGLGLASLVGHRRGADVTASDCHPLAEAFLLENLRLNGLLPMKYRHGQWGLNCVSPGLQTTDVQGEFDLIIGSDLLYERDADATLAAFITLHAAPLAEVWIVDPDRGNRPAFNRDMSDQGFSRIEHRLTPLLPPGGGAPPAYKGRVLVYRRGLALTEEPVT